MILLYSLIALSKCLHSSLSQDGQTALMLAAGSGSLELVNILIECGADVNHQNKVCTYKELWACARALCEQ